MRERGRKGDQSDVNTQHELITVHLHHKTMRYYTRLVVYASAYRVEVGRVCITIDNKDYGIMITDHFHSMCFFCVHASHQRSNCLGI